MVILILFSFSFDFINCLGTAHLQIFSFPFPLLQKILVILPRNQKRLDVLYLLSFFFQARSFHFSPFNHSTKEPPSSRIQSAPFVSISPSNHAYQNPPRGRCPLRSSVRPSKPSSKDPPFQTKLLLQRRRRRTNLSHRTNRTSEPIRM